MERSINERWIIPFKKFGMVRVNTRAVHSYSYQQVYLFISKTFQVAKYNVGKYYYSKSTQIPVLTFPM